MAAPQYGAAHRAARKAALARLVPGQRCPLCSLPMYATPAQALAAGLPRQLGLLHLDHWTPVMLGGAGGPTRLVHARCNTQTGGLLGAIVTNARNGYPVGSSPRRRRRRAPGPLPPVPPPVRYTRW
jgi:hypothetical protein